MNLFVEAFLSLLTFFIEWMKEELFKINKHLVLLAEKIVFLKSMKWKRFKISSCWMLRTSVLVLDFNQFCLWKWVDSRILLIISFRCCVDYFYKLLFFFWFSFYSGLAILILMLQNQTNIWMETQHSKCLSSNMKLIFFKFKVFKSLLIWNP